MPEKALRLIKKDPDLLKEIVISAYPDGIISLGKAAEVLGVTREELMEEFKNGESHQNPRQRRRSLRGGGYNVFVGEND